MRRGCYMRFAGRWLPAVLAAACLANAAVADITPNPDLMSPAIYRKVRAVQAMIRSAQYDQALTQLDYLNTVTTNAYENTVVHDMLAQVDQADGKYQDALSNLKQALAGGVMSHAEQQTATLMLGKLFVSTAQYTQAIATLRNWLAATPNPSADALITLALAYAKAGQCAPAAPYARRAVQQTHAAPESWYLLWLSCLYQTRDYPGATEVLYTLLGRWPQHVEYWRQLGESYAQLGDNNRALAVYALMYRQGMMHGQQDYLNLFSLYRQNHLPYQAAQLLQSWLDAGSVSASMANYDLLAGAWLDAKERGKAIAALGQAGKLTTSGEPYLQQAQLYLSQHEWFAVINATKQALAKGGLSQPGQAYLLQGVGEAQNKQFAEAQIALKQAATFAATRAQAQTWLRYVNSRASQTS